MADDEGLNARVPAAPGLGNGDVIEEDLELRKQQRHVLESEDFCHKVAANFQNVRRDVQGWKVTTDEKIFSITSEHKNIPKLGHVLA